MGQSWVGRGRQGGIGGRKDGKTAVGCAMGEIRNQIVPERGRRAVRTLKGAGGMTRTPASTSMCCSDEVMADLNKTRLQGPVKSAMLWNEGFKGSGSGAGRISGG